MTLEPTEEQADRIAARLMHEFSIAADDALMSIDELWPLFRDMVLEAAAVECEAQGSALSRVGGSRDHTDIADRCAAAVRTLKGKP